MTARFAHRVVVMKRDGQIAEMNDPRVLMEDEGSHLFELIEAVGCETRQRRGSTEVGVCAGTRGRSQGGTALPTYWAWPKVGDWQGGGAVRARFPCFFFVFFPCIFPSMAPRYIMIQGHVHVLNVVGECGACTLQAVILRYCAETLYSTPE